jgi:hypothetical protein
LEELLLYMSDDLQLLYCSNYNDTSCFDRLKKSGLLDIL